MHGQMTSRERVLAAIGRETVDRIPTDYWGTPEATRKLINTLGVKNEMGLWKILNVDKIMGVGPRYIGPELKTEGEIKTDYWGVKSKPVKYAGNEGTYMEMCYHPLEGLETIDEIEEKYTWPHAGWFDFSDVGEQCAKHPYYAVMGGYAAPFYMYTNIRGAEQTFIDFAADEEIANYILDRICTFLYEYHRRLFDAAGGRIDIAQLTDDFGTQTGLIISPDMFEKYFGGHYRKFARLFRDYEIKIFHHDDGAIMPIIPKLADIGIDVLNPIQWHLPGMDLKKLKNRYGNKLCFHGGIDNQYVLPFGTVEEVKQEVLTCLDILGGDGTGYILAPCHNVQVISPVENIVMMYKTAQDYVK